MSTCTLTTTTRSSYPNRSIASRFIAFVVVAVLSGVLDVALYLFRYGQLYEIPLVEKLFDHAVVALAVPVEKPVDLADDGARKVATFGPNEPNERQ